MKRYLFILTATLCVLSVLLVASTPSTYADSVNSTIVHTASGTLKGSINEGTRQFLGIPYAAPPVGNLRWKAPQPVTPWSGTRDATQFGSVCTQAGAVPGGALIGSENCLFLNVYTPNRITANLPVMVWIHGGSFVFGAGSQYDPSVMVKQGNVIVVTINYRLGSFGFLALPSLSAEAANGSTGNYGLEDQQAALRWVKTNIAHFGGNSHNVTIFGESAGGASVCDQIGSPFATGLFQKAITESGPCEAEIIPTPTLTAAQALGTSLAAKVGCSGDTGSVLNTCMRAVPASALVANTNANIITFAPTIDGVELPRAVKTSLELGLFNHVPIIEGSNHDEGSLFVVLQVFATGVEIPVTPAQYAAIIGGIFGANAPAVLAQYPISKLGSADQAFSQVLTDWGFACPSRTSDQLLSKQVPTFAYQFSDPNPPGIAITPPDFTVGDFHSSELQYIFQGGVGSLLSKTPSPLSAQQTVLSNQMISYWTTFATIGNPNSFRTPHWSRYHSATDTFQSLTSAGNGISQITTFSSEHQCGFWSTLGV
jgi:para-nitrobenzyl esterase